MAERRLTPVLSSHLPIRQLKALQLEKESKHGEAYSHVCLLMGMGSLLTNGEFHGEGTGSWLEPHVSHQLLL